MNTDQIAAGAVKLLMQHAATHCGVLLNEFAVTQHIKSAIEKATALKDEALTANRTYTEHVERLLAESRAAHASEHKYDEDGVCEVCGQELECRPAEVRTVAAAHASEHDFEQGKRPCMKAETDGISISHGGVTPAQNALDKAHSEGVAVGLASANKPDSATASELEIGHGLTKRIIRSGERNPDSASTGMIKIKHSGGRGDYGEDYDIPAATPSGGGREWHPLIPPSGGGEWTVERLSQYADPNHSDLNQLASAINAALRDCWNDTKRMDWLETSIIDEKSDPLHQFISLKCGPLVTQLTLTMFNARHTQDFTSESLREAIDAAMSQTKEKE